MEKRLAFALCLSVVRAAPVRDMVSNMAFFDRVKSAFTLNKQGKNAAKTAPMRSLGFGYNAAVNNGIMGAWGMSSASATVEAQGAITNIRNHVRDLIRNDAHAARIVSSWATNTIGAGFDCHADTGDPARNEKLDALWAEFKRTCNADGSLGGYIHLQNQAARALYSDGEYYVKRRWVKPKKGQRIPLKIELLEADFCDHNYNTNAPNAPTNTIINGHEYAESGEIAAYWLFKDHPGNGGLFSTGTTKYNLDYERVSASDCVHGALLTRPGQVRGISILAPVVESLRILSDLRHAHKIQQLTQANVTAVVEGCDGDSDGLYVKLSDGTEMQAYTQEAGTVLQVAGARKYVAPPITNDAAYSANISCEEHAVAAGVDMPFDEMTGILSEVNFASSKAGRLAFTRKLKNNQSIIFAPTLCDAVWDWFVEAVFVARLYDKPTANHRTTLPHIEGLDRKAEADADERELTNQTRSYFDLVRSQGRDPLKIADENKEALALYKSRGIKPPAFLAQYEEPAPVMEAANNGQV